MLAVGDVEEGACGGGDGAEDHDVSFSGTSIRSSPNEIEESELLGVSSKGAGTSKDWAHHDWQSIGWTKDALTRLNIKVGGHKNVLCFSRSVEGSGMKRTSVCDRRSSHQRVLLVPTHKLLGAVIVTIRFGVVLVVTLNTTSSQSSSFFSSC